MPLFTSAKHKAVTSQRQPPQAASLPASENRAYAALAQQAVDKAKQTQRVAAAAQKQTGALTAECRKLFCSQKSQKASANRRRRTLTIHQRSRGGRSLRFGLSSVFSTLRRCRRARKEIKTNLLDLCNLQCIETCAVPTKENSVQCSVIKTKKTIWAKLIKAKQQINTKVNTKINTTGKCNNKFCEFLPEICEYVTEIN